VHNRAETQYAIEDRRVNGQDVKCVLLDSVASQANRRELALLEASRRGELCLPLVSVDFRGTPVAYLDRISSLEAPHRIFDALLRDSLLDGVLFRFSPVGQAVTEATHRNAAALLRWSPTTLLFGGWDSTGPKGGQGAKYERAITAEVTGIHVLTGKKTSSRIDPAGIESSVRVYESAEPDEDWTVDEERARMEKGVAVLVKSKGEKQAGRASQINHGNIAPSIDTRAGGVTVDRVEATTVVSFMALRRLRFPTDGEGQPFADASRDAAERAARTALAALGLAATVLALDDGFDLRSRCVLVPTAPPSFELRRRTGEAEPFELDRETAVRLLDEAVAELGAAGLSWERDELLLQPAQRLVDLIARSHELAAEGPTGTEALPAGAEA
jgi:CRISPR-associated protein Csb1